MSRLSERKSQKQTYLKNVFNVRYKGNVNFAPVYETRSVQSWPNKLHRIRPKRFRELPTFITSDNNLFETMQYKLKESHRERLLSS